MALQGRASAPCIHTGIARAFSKNQAYRKTRQHHLCRDLGLPRDKVPQADAAIRLRIGAFFCSSSHVSNISTSHK
jgi:hypothetical protein